MTKGKRESLGRFLAPRWWPTWLLLLWMRVSTWLPWPWGIRIHKGVGRLLCRIMRRRRHIVRRNIEICFPEYDNRTVDAVVERNFENATAALAEMAMAWFGPIDRLTSLFTVEGMQNVDAAFSKGKGVIFYSGHFTTLEICAPVLKSLVPSYAFMFRRRKNALINEMQARGREKAAHHSFANTDVRAMLRSLRGNSGVWYAPDQVSRGANSALLPFFGEPAMTNTATSKLARISGAPIVPFFFFRLPDDSGYVLRFDPALDDFPSDDMVRDTERLVRVLEGFIEECPDQYLWTHRKFKGRPAEYPDVYARP